jgi:hypothetical protein
MVVVRSLGDSIAHCRLGLPGQSKAEMLCGVAICDNRSSVVSRVYVGVALGLGVQYVDQVNEQATCMRS